MRPMVETVHHRGVPEADGAARAQGYADCRRRVRALLEGISEADEHVIVPACPDWTVRNTVAHLSGICADLLAGRRPEGDTQAWVDAQVTDRADTPVADLLDEWDEAGPGFEALVRDKSPEGLGGLLYDVVAHEHDIAAALGRTGDRDNNGVDLSLDILAGLVHADVMANGLGVTEFGDGHTTWTVGPISEGTGSDDVAFRVTAPKYELMRFLGSRRSLAQMRTFEIDGDLDAHLPGLAHLPLPDADLVE